jgi:glycosyltransferase involved in cell wall biosynthesis
MEYPATGGPQLRVLNSVEVLNSVSELTILNQDANATQETEKFFRKISHSYYSLKRENSPILGRRKLFFRIFRRLSKRKYKYETYQFLKLLSEIEVDIIWFGFGNISYPLIREIRKMHPNKILVCDTDSVWSRYLLRGLPYLKLRKKFSILLSGLRKRYEEAKLVKICDVITAVSEVDADYYRNLGDKTKIFSFSNVIDLKAYAYEIENKFIIKKSSIFLGGSFGEAGMPMNVATRWFLKEVFPIILRVLPEAHLYIVGRRSEKEFGIFESPNITVTGMVESVLPYLKFSDVSVVPLHFESGTRFKILEAGASRVPIVSTSLGAEGIKVINNVHLLIADSSEDFAEAVCKILLDRQLSNDLSNNCFALVANQYCLEYLKIEAESIINFVTNR